MKPRVPIGARRGGLRRLTAGFWLAALVIGCPKNGLTPGDEAPAGEPSGASSSPTPSASTSTSTVDLAHEASPSVSAQGLSLREGDSASLSQGARITIDRIVYVDSPCPVGARCIWSGVRKEVEATVERDSEARKLRLALKKPVEVFGLTLAVAEVEPTRCVIRVLGAPLRTAR